MRFSSNSILEARTLPTFPDLFRRLRLWTPSLAIDGEIVAGAALLGAALVVGLSTAADYGLTLSGEANRVRKKQSSVIIAVDV
jgi:hypothetical protein